MILLCYRENKRDFEINLTKNLTKVEKNVIGSEFDRLKTIASNLIVAPIVMGFNKLPVDPGVKSD